MSPVRIGTPPSPQYRLSHATTGDRRNGRTCLGDLDGPLRALADDPDAAGRAEDALDDIEIFAK
ncbi:hypothetical protein GCM10011591_26530 [Nocardia camponoti]|uniref:Uncharacterized protein n=1 Tax=Nocardia camponoti TaxID=1616106 RepID=A0A917QJB7_9NOCA|nr:hypothetical protein GCM10011591_26530 [Nocardia camponoti]